MNIMKRIDLVPVLEVIRHKRDGLKLVVDSFIFIPIYDMNGCIYKFIFSLDPIEKTFVKLLNVVF